MCACPYPNHSYYCGHLIGLNCQTNPQLQYGSRSQSFILTALSRIKSVRSLEIFIFFEVKFTGELRQDDNCSVLSIPYVVYVPKGTNEVVQRQVIHFFYF